jgi:rhodanese-related sulfurtransferase
MKTVTPAQALEMVKAGQAHGIDVREKDEWDSGHFDLFTLNSLSTFDESLLPTDKPIIFICRSGNRSGEACTAVEPSGLDVINMEGGMLAWQSEGLPMTTKTGTPKIS